MGKTTKLAYNTDAARVGVNNLSSTSLIVTLADRKHFHFLPLCLSRSRSIGRAKYAASVKEAHRFVVNVVQYVGLSFFVSFHRVNPPSGPDKAWYVDIITDNASPLLRSQELLRKYYRVLAPHADRTQGE
jgi:hypothetical protein